jgi:ATP synthase protein I
MFDSVDDVDEIRTLSKEEAALVRASNPALNLGWVIIWQIGAVLVAALFAWGFTQQLSVVYSLVWGGFSVVLPAAVFAFVLQRWAAKISASQAVGRFLLLEMLKLALTLGMMFAAMRVIENVSWLALLVGLVVTMKVYWIALLVQPRVSQAKQN